MRLAEVSTAASGPLVFLCAGCGERINQAHEKVYADLDGKSFQAYYHGPCAATPPSFFFYPTGAR